MDNFGAQRFENSASAADHYRRQLEVVCKNATAALFIMNERQECVYMNPAAERLTGYTLEEVRGRALHDMVHHTRPDGSPYPLEECPIDRAFPQNNQEHGEEVFVHKGGHFYPVAYTASPIRESDGIVGTILEVRDFSREKRHQQERTETTRHLQQTIAELRRTEQRLREESELVETINRVGQSMASELTCRRSCKPARMRRRS